MKAYKVERTITNEEKMQHYNKLKEKIRHTAAVPLW